YRVTDAASSSQCSPDDKVTVNPALVAGTTTPSTPTIDNRQSITLTANPSGGTTPYSYGWYSAAGCPSGSLISGASSSTYLASPTSVAIIRGYFVNLYVVLNHDHELFVQGDRFRILFRSAVLGRRPRNCKSHAGRRRHYSFYSVDQQRPEYHSLDQPIRWNHTLSLPVVLGS